ncbi:MAG: thiamine ABC transporter substrate binding subunit [Alphaproteobacteria bacterium]|nr:MAG: thiamine ABC transporter substrate binding subunit [Alphaproteobacteria bacterium]
MRQLFLALLSALLPFAAAAQDRPVLTVYTYDSFVSDWGPGPEIEKRFEAVCDCDLQFVGSGDGAALLARIRLEGANTRADIALGLDNNLIAEAAATGLFAPHGLSPKLDLPVAWDDPVFLPYDWGHFAFVYDSTKLADPPDSFAALMAAPESLKIIIEDPRSSTPGLGLVMWIKAIYGDEAGAVWRRLAPHILTVTKGWSEAYGLFLEGEADMVLSYTTSPAYHRIAEGDDTKRAAIFSEGHGMQIEVAALMAGAKHPDLARRFLRFMLSDAFQEVIPTTNWMFPAVTPAAGLPEGFAEPLPAGASILLPPEKVPALRKAALAEWREALSR